MAANIGDNYSLTIINISMMILAALELCLNKPCEKAKLKINVFYLIYPVISVVISKIIVKSLNAHGFWKFDYNFELQFAKWEDLGRNIANTLHLLFCFFGGDVFGKKLSMESLTDLLGIVILVGTLTVFVYTLIHYTTQDIINKFLVVIIIVQTCAYTFSSLNTGTLETDRYMTAPVIMLSILFARTDLWRRIADSCLLQGILSDKPIRNICVCLLFGLIIIGKIAPLPKQEIDQSGKKISDFLVQNNLQNGYATFWNSHNVTIENLDSVRVAPIYVSEDTIHKQEWLNNQQYFEEYSDYILINNSMDEITVNELEDILGKCKMIYKLDEYTICVWDYDISQKILH